MPNEDDLVIIATVKCVAHADAVEGTQQVASGGVLDCSTVEGMNAAVRLLLLETMGVRSACDDCVRRHFRNRISQPQDGSESPRNAEVAHWATLIGDQRLVVRWRLRPDMASLGIGVTTVFGSDLRTYPGLRAFFQDLVKV